MGDWLQFVVDESATSADAAGRASRLRAHLVATGWITASQSERGHRPGGEVASRYQRERGEVDLLALRTNEVSIEAKPFTNLASAPYPVELLRCSRCSMPPDLTALHEHVDRWLREAVEPRVACPRCGHIAPLRELDPPGDVVCGHLAITFSNWPPLEDGRWSRKILDDVVECLGVRPVVAQAKR